jgi:tetratricopeptide (TPR) repeat protein
MENFSALLERFLKSQTNRTKQYFDIDEIVSLIDYFLDNDDMPNLKAIVELGYKLHPEDAGFRIALCNTLIAAEEFGAALKLIETVEETRNKNYDLLRIECYCELDRIDDALMLIDKLTAANSHYLEDAFVQITSMMNDLEKDHDRTYRLIKHALTMFPDSRMLKSELCFCLELQGRTKEGLALCRELINEDPYSAEIWYLQGRLYSLCDDFERSIDSLDFALTCIGENEDDDEDSGLEYEIKLMKAYCLYKNESYEKAAGIYEELKTYEEYDDLAVEPSLAGCYMKLNDYEKAYRILKRLADNKKLEDDVEVSVYGNLICCCIETERREEAIDLLSDMLSVFPGNILEYLSTLNMTPEQLTELPYDLKGHVIGNLARTYLNSKLHNN